MFAISKSKLNIIEVLVSKALIDSNINRDKFASINNMLKEFYDLKEKMKILMINEFLNYV